MSEAESHDSGAKSYVAVEIEGRVATVRFDRGDAKNRLDLEAISQLTEVAYELGRDFSLSAVVLTGAESVFSAGADVQDDGMREMSQAGMSSRRQILKRGSEMCRAWEALEPVTICAIEGLALGGGVALALACDFRIFAASGHVELPEIPVGMTLAWQTIPRLINAIGPTQAKLAIILGDRIGAEKALSLGLAIEVCRDGEALARGRALADRIASLPPLPVRMSKNAVNAFSNALHGAVFHMDSDQWLAATAMDDYAEGLAAFYGKRPGVFTGR